MGHHSLEKLGISCGVPQDISDVFQALKLNLFADDNNIFYSSNNYTDLVTTLNKELMLIKKNWMDRNTVSYH